MFCFQLIGTVADASIAEVLLSRGVMPLLSYYAGHRNVAKKLLRKLVSLWATSEKKVRVLAFLGIFRLTRLLPDSFMDGVLRVRKRFLICLTSYNIEKIVC